MNHKILVPSLLLLLAPLARAQGGPGPEHKELQRFVGTWQVHVENHMTPDGTPMAMEGLDETTSICGGMWLMTTVTGQGMPFSGMSYLGYDPMQKKYVGVWVDSMSAYPSVSTGTYDAKTSTFTTFADMVTPMGPVKTRSVMEWKGNDERVETAYSIGAEGKETLWMKITSTRMAKDKKAAPAAATKGEAPSDMQDPKDPMHKTLAAWAGTWDAACSMEMPGAPEKMEGKMTQVDTLVCGDLWLHTKATGSFGGMPFEGHGLMGYDPTKKQFVSFWVDAFSPVLAQSHGTSKDDGKVMQMAGSSFDMTGTKTKSDEVTTWKDKDHRTLTMKSTYENGTSAGTMTIEYSRAVKK